MSKTIKGKHNDFIEKDCTFNFEGKSFEAGGSYLLKRKDSFGGNLLGKGKNCLIEFVSANPTGPLSIAHGRQAAIGASLARILESSSYKVEKEYYINDEGTQIDLLEIHLNIDLFSIKVTTVLQFDKGYSIALGVRRDALQQFQELLDSV